MEFQETDEKTPTGVVTISFFSLFPLSKNRVFSLCFLSNFAKSLLLRSDKIIDYATMHKMNVVIPPKKNRNEQRSYDQYLYKMRHLVENAFLHLKRWRGIATRYCKNTASFLAAVQCCCIFLWAKILA